MKLPEPDPRETRDDTPEEWRNEWQEWQDEIDRLEGDDGDE